MKKKFAKILIVLLFLLAIVLTVSCDGKAPIISMHCPNCHFEFNYARVMSGMTRICPDCGTKVTLR